MVFGLQTPTIAGVRTRVPATARDQFLLEQSSLKSQASVKGHKRAGKQNRVYLSAMVAPHTKEVYYQASAAYKSGGRFLDALMAALEGIVLQPQADDVKAKRGRAPAKTR